MSAQLNQGKIKNLIFICAQYESESHLLKQLLNASRWKTLLGNPCSGSVGRLPLGRRHQILQYGIHVEDKRNQSGPNRGPGIQQVRLTFASIDNGQGGAACVVHGQSQEVY